MDIKYKRNCQLYYDESEQATYIVKRNKKFMIYNSPQEYQLLLKIISKSVKKTALENMADGQETDSRKVLQYVKLLLDKGILYLYHDTDYSLEEEFKEYIITNFDRHYEVLDFISSCRIAVLKDPVLAKYYADMGLVTINIDNFTEETADAYDIFIGEFEEEELRSLGEKGKHVLLLKRSEGNCSILYTNRFDPELLEQYQEFYISNSSSSIYSRIILPINILFHLLENVFETGSRNLRYITKDAAVQLFALKEVNKDSLQYYDRSIIEKKNDLSVIREIEEMVKTDPHLVWETNRDNAVLKHAPVCNYEILFGRSLSFFKYSRYHEDNARAGMLAITGGIERALTEVDPNGYWVCAASPTEYYIKGYLRILSALAEPEKACRLVTDSKQIQSLLEYILRSYGPELEIWYENLFEGAAGKLYITDGAGNIAYEQDNVWQQETAVKDGLFEIIGRFENGQDIFGDTLHSRQKDRSLPAKALTQEKLLALLTDYFRVKFIIIDEKPWAYQSNFEKAGLHVGRFYII